MSYRQIFLIAPVAQSEDPKNLEDCKASLRVPWAFIIIASPQTEVGRAVDGHRGASEPSGVVAWAATWMTRSPEASGRAFAVRDVRGTNHFQWRENWVVDYSAMGIARSW